MKSLIEGHRIYQLGSTANSAIFDLFYALHILFQTKYVCLFVCNRGDSFMSQDGLRTRKLCQSPMPDHCCNSGIIRGASPRCFPYTITRLLLKSQHVMRDTALEFGPPSGTGKLIPLLLDAGTSSCTRLPPPTDGIFPHLAHSHTCFTAQV